MAILLKRSRFKRDRRREKNAGDFFSKASTSLNKISSLALRIFFTPVMMATSLFSQEIVLMLINISLSLGYLTNLGYRIFNKQIGKAELLVTGSLLSTFMVGGYLLFPAIASLTSLLGVVSLVNQISVGINVFFLFRSSIVPPVMRYSKYIGEKIGIDIKEEYYQIELLDVDKDKHVLNALLQKHFSRSLCDEKPIQIEVEKLNNLLQILASYINKYSGSVLGDVRYKKAIMAMENHIDQITKQGSADSSYTFIKRKLAFKQVTLELLKEARHDLENEDWSTITQYYKGIQKSVYQENKTKYHEQANKILEEEISTQEVKCNQLSSCLP